MEEVMTLPLKVDISPSLDLQVTRPMMVNLGMDMAVKVDGIPYAGRTVVVPSDEDQTLMTAGTLLTRDVVVKAIPNNYGKVTWNGSYLFIE